MGNVRLSPAEQERMLTELLGKVSTASVSLRNAAGEVLFTYDLGVVRPGEEIEFHVPSAEDFGVSITSKPA